eukprot:scaffold77535_cov20-Tisochrysis_lutea.AAC.3
MQMHHAHAQQFEVISMRCNRSHALQKRPAQGTATGKSAIAGALQPSHAHSTHPVQLKVLSSDSMKVGWCCWNCMKLLKVQAVALRWDSAALRATA